MISNYAIYSVFLKTITKKIIDKTAKLTKRNENSEIVVYPGNKIIDSFTSDAAVKLIF